MEVFQVLVVLVVWILNVLVEFWVLKVDIGDTIRVHFRFGRFLSRCKQYGLSVLMQANRKTLEFHHVLSQSARFVTKYVVDHAKLLVEIG